MLSTYKRIQWGESGVLSITDLSSVSADSRQIEKDCLFVAVRGSHSDGHDYLDQAAQKGAKAIVVEDLARVPTGFKGAVIQVEDSRQALNQLAARFYGDPSQELFVVGVTGTNGKTSVTHMVESIFHKAGRPMGVIGTIDHHLGERVWKTDLTTPDPVSFQKRLREFVDLGAKGVALEVSSIGLVQSRVDEVEFDVAVFTNLTRDHLDYHKTMDDYFQAKRKLFSELLLRSRKVHPRAVINGDDEFGRRLLSEMKDRSWSYGAKSRGVHDLAFEILDQGFYGTRFKLATPQGESEFELRMIGQHNVYNAVAAIGGALCAGVSLRQCAEALVGLTGVRGRLESVPNPLGIHAFVDYAHTDDAIATVLRYLNDLRRQAGISNRIITVFGCGGDRDRGKRPLMMKAARNGSDLVIVTSDNPRTEDPEKIIDDILVAADRNELNERIWAITDRRAAIRRAVEVAKPGDVILVAGKGHEDYQIIGTTKTPFSDVEILKEVAR